MKLKNSYDGANCKNLFEETKGGVRELYPKGTQKKEGTAKIAE
ncbi:uncharacterized protein G2W53_003869 [Senna tora]|uniref:Uncharacterized protein n=1 Tax=Senna tora TaxID=362788 RepID=A0A835CG52_9FABA|nr:uncharacterized protein G2W53_003869 [Senna tora]